MLLHCAEKQKLYHNIIYAVELWSCGAVELWSCGNCITGYAHVKYLAQFLPDNRVCTLKGDGLYCSNPVV